MVFFKTLPRSVKTNFMTKGHGQGVLKRKNYWPQVSVDFTIGYDRRLVLE